MLKRPRFLAFPQPWPSSARNTRNVERADLEWAFDSSCVLHLALLNYHIFEYVIVENLIINIQPRNREILLDGISSSAHSALFAIITITITIMITIMITITITITIMITIMIMIMIMITIMMRKYPRNLPTGD